MKGLDYSKFKKIASDKKSTTLRHKDGHELTIAHGNLSSQHRDALHKLPMSKEVKFFVDGGTAESEKSSEDKSLAKSFGEAIGSAGRRVAAPIAQGVKDTYDAYSRLGQGVSQGASDLASGISQGAGLETPPSAPVQAPPNIAEDAPQSIPEPSPTLAPSPPQPVTQEPAAVPPQATPESSTAQTEEQVAAKDLRAESKAVTPEQAAADAKGFMANERAAFEEDLAKGHIQPKTYQSYFHDQSTLGKIGAVFGMFLGGVGGGLTGQPNAYLETMDKLIQRDLEAQEKSNSNAQNWYQTRLKHMEVMNDGRKLTLEEKKQARAMAESDMLESTFHNLKLKASGNPSSPEVQKAQAALAAIYPVIQTKINNIQDLAAGAVAYSKTAAGMTANMSQGQKDVDQQYAKDYTKWISEDKTSAEAALNQLEEAKAALQKNHSLSGGLTGVLPERLTSSEVLAQRRRILKAGLPALKATFGGQLSDSERKAYLESIYNEKADAKTNIAGLDDFINKVRTDMTRKNSLASEYQKRGSISSYKPELSTPEATPETIERLDPKSGKTVIYDAKTKQPLRFK